MKRTLLITLACVFLLALALPAAAVLAWAQGKPQDTARAAAQEFASAFGPDYLIGPGDILEISVWKEEALTKQVVVLPDGKLSFPLIGEVQAAGRPLADLKKELAAKLARYAPKEEVNLEVKQVNSMVIYVIGRVNQPGRFALNTNVNVLQALSIAGGLNAFAKRNQVKIFRQEAGGTTILPFSYDEVTEGEKLRQNIILKRGDVVVVP